MGDYPEIIEERLEHFEKKLKSGCKLTEEETKELHGLFSAVEGAVGYETITSLANRVKAMLDEQKGPIEKSSWNPLYTAVIDDYH